MADSPHTVMAFNERFHDDDARRAYLESIRYARIREQWQRHIWITVP